MLIKAEYVSDDYHQKLAPKEATLEQCLGVITSYRSVSQSYAVPKYNTGLTANGHLVFQAKTLNRTDIITIIPEDELDRRFITAIFGSDLALEHIQFLDKVIDGNVVKPEYNKQLVKKGATIILSQRETPSFNEVLFSLLVAIRSKDPSFTCFYQKTNTSMCWVYNFIMYSVDMKRSDLFSVAAMAISNNLSMTEILMLMEPIHHNYNVDGSIRI